MGVEVIGAAISLVGGIYSASEQSKARKAASKAADEERKARKAQMATEELQAQRARRDAIREAQQKRASLIASGESAGVSGSSGVASGAGSIATQGASNVGFLQASAGGTRLANTALSRAADLTGEAALHRANAGIGKGLFDQGGGFQNLAKTGASLFS